MLVTCAAHIQAMTRHADVEFRGYSPVSELRLAFLDERRHAFLLVLGREEGVKQPPLEEDALSERRLVRTVYRLLGHHHRRQRELRDSLRRGERCVPPAPGMMPSLISGWPNLAVSAAIRMSHIIASSQPPPRA